MNFLKVTKRNGSLVEFDLQRIVNAIEKAMVETEIGVDSEVSYEIAEEIEDFIKEKDEIIFSGDGNRLTNPYRLMNVEEIQDMVELKLMKKRPDVAKKYILYREDRRRMRGSKSDSKYKMITDEFISKYKHKKDKMTDLGKFVYYRTYSRLVHEEHRREYWWETVRRAVEFNTKLAPTSKEEAQKLFDNIFNLKQFLAGRTLWIGNTEVAYKYGLSNMNCAFCVIDSFDMFSDLFYLLLVGAGVGFRVLPSDVAKMPKVRTNINILSKAYNGVPKDDRQEYTSLTFNDNIAQITIGDSKEGWVQGIKTLFELLTSRQYSKITNIVISYDHIRPMGEPLKTFGGYASGHGALQTIIEKIAKIVEKYKNERYKNLSAVDCLDICNIIAEGVVVGGVRRSSELALGSPDDDNFIEAKSNLYTQNNGIWSIDTDIAHRQMSNNTIFYDEKPTREKLHWQIEQMRYSGEPAFLNAGAARNRRPNFNGVNPCGEILLDSKQNCNLTTVNVYSFVEDGVLDREGLLEAQRLSARAGYRMTFLELELHEWNVKQNRDRLTGCSLTGWQDMVNEVGLSKDEEAELLRELRETAHKAIDDYSKELNAGPSLLITTVKPEGTLSQLPTVSSGVHYSHSPYYLRRIRVNATDPMVSVCEELGYNIYPEVGQTMEDCRTKVVEFPVKAPKGKTKYDVSAIEQLENYKMFMRNYVDHNCSITVSVREHEWDDVEQWLWDNWDDVVAVSFLSLDDSFYELMPYQAISEDEYEDFVKNMKPFNPSLLSKYEQFEEFELIDGDCETGICPVR